MVMESQARVVSPEQVVSLSIDSDESESSSGLAVPDVDEITAYLDTRCGVRFYDVYDPTVAQLASEQSFPDGMVPMSWCTGPAIKTARISALVGWAALLMFSIAAYKTSTCDSSGFVYYPFQLWLFFIPLWLLKLYWQHMCLKYTTIPFVQATGDFKICNCLNFGFTTWYAMTCIMSISQTADYGTDSFFTAVVLRAGQCKEGRVNHIWHEVMAQSRLSMFSSIDFSTVAVISYALMFFQPLTAFLTSTPICFARDPVDYRVGKDNSFRNCLGILKNMGDALYDLADASDMCAIQVQSPKFPMARAKHVWEHPEAPNKVRRVLSFSHNALNRSLARLALGTLLENTYQINLQVSILAIFFFLLDNDADAGHPLANLQLQTQISIVLSATHAFIKLGEVMQQVCFSIWLVKNLRSAKDEASDVEPVARTEFAWVIAKVVLVVLISVLFVLLTIYAIAKYYHVFFCEDRLWNVTGCVDMSAFK